MSKLQQFDDILVACSDDYAGMSDVVTRCLREVNSKDYPPTVIDDLVNRHQPEALASRLEDPEKHALVVKQRGEVVGTGVLDGDEITTVFVDPDIHARGIGRKIMHALEQEALRRELPHVEVHSSLTAVRFYEKLGYQHLEHVDREVGGESLHMRKMLST